MAWELTITIPDEVEYRAFERSMDLDADMNVSQPKYATYALVMDQAQRRARVTAERQTLWRILRFVFVSCKSAEISLAPLRPSAQTETSPIAIIGCKMPDWAG